MSVFSLHYPRRSLGLANYPIPQPHVTTDIRYDSHFSNFLGKQKMVRWTSVFTIGITLTVKTPPQLRTTDTLTLCTSPINLCTTGWVRTTDTWFWRPVLYQLSYRRVYWGRYRNWTYVDSFADYRLNHSTNRPCSVPDRVRTCDSFIKSEVL